MDSLLCLTAACYSETFWFHYEIETYAFIMACACMWISVFMAPKLTQMVSQKG